MFLILCFINTFFKIYSSNYYVRYNSMIYNMVIENNIASADFTSLFPLDLSFINSDSNDYYILVRNRKTYENSLFNSRNTFLIGDIALLENNIYVIFKKTMLVETKSIYIGNINNFESILNNPNIQTDDTDTSKLLFESENICSPYILGINGEKDIKIKMEGFGSKRHSTINFSTRGTKKLEKVPSIYLNNTYLGGDCSIEGDGYSIICTITYEKWYENKENNIIKSNQESFVKYRLNELYEGCYGPVYTGINLFISGANIQISLYIILISFILIF